MDTFNLDDIVFIEETEANFQTRMVDVKRKLAILDESFKILKEIPILLKWLEYKWVKPPAEFEDRLKKFGEDLNKLEENGR